MQEQKKRWRLIEFRNDFVFYQEAEIGINSRPSTNKHASARRIDSARPPSSRGDRQADARVRARFLVSGRTKGPGCTPVNRERHRTECAAYEYPGSPPG